MTKLTKFGAMLLAGSVIAGMMTGCGGSSNSASSTSTDASTSTGSDSIASSSGETYNVSFIVKLTDGHFLKVMAGAQAYADEHPNVTVNFLSPTSSTAYDEQINMIETSLTNDQYDAVIISPLQSDTTATLVANTNKVVIACDTDFTSDKKIAFVGTGNEDAAYQGGKAAVEAAKARGLDADGKITAVILTGVQGDETHDARLAGYTKGITEAGGEVVEVQYCDGVADKAANAMETLILKYSDGVDIVCSGGDDMVMAAARSIRDSGNANFANTVLCGFDGNQVALEAVQDGSLALDVAQEGYQMGYKAMEAAIAALSGETVDSFIDSGVTVVSSDNVADYIDTMKSIGVWSE